MKELVNAIRQLAKQLPADDSFPWDMPENVPIEIPATITSPRQRHIHLKEHLHKKLKNDPDLSVHYWLIQEWGKIGSLKKNEKNNKKLRDLPKQLEKGRLQRRLFDVISSLSKVAAFREPAKYSIYDSRAVLVLNWLLFRHTEERYLFPIPSGRGESVTEFDTPTMYRLSGLDYKIKEWNVAYHDYCSLLLDLSVRALGEARPYHLEMLLFVAADRWIRGVQDPAREPQPVVASSLIGAARSLSAVVGKVLGDQRLPTRPGK